jgi:hypothetical protein
LTTNFLLLFNVPLGVVTVTKPVVAPVGTVVLIKEGKTTLKTAAVPLNVSFDPAVVLAIIALPLKAGPDWLAGGGI